MPRNKTSPEQLAKPTIMATFKLLGLRRTLLLMAKMLDETATKGQSLPYDTLDGEDDPNGPVDPESLRSAAESLRNILDG